ncbi:mRNA surveillance protein Pelota [Ignicoccus islandicus DSM 13165]|uniref:Protein pelota homolog n=1 Tax=Ignicoccus islandicus DSM 13165 TaxID=940295 RepID=A0A0U3E1K8_9CREN|nr:pelota family protein [Ignicoccus islandicus]ALU11803.1 mRNA surveillance protein Pelota [Ignicoccus islandicus DSM 13165]
MKLLEVNPSKGEVKLRVEDEEDLWTLYTILRKGDLVRAKTVRSIAKGGSKEKIPMTLTIKVSDIEFQPFAQVLRIRGTVVEGPDRFGLKGSSHAIRAYPGKELTIIRENGSEDIVRKVKAASMKKPKVAVLSVDTDDYALAIVRGQGIEWVLEGSMQIPGKLDENREAIVKANVKELAKKVLEELNKRGIQNVVVVGPGFFKERVADELRAMGLNVKVDTVSSGDRVGVLEAIKKGSLGDVIKDLESVKALEVIEEAIKRIAKDRRDVCYGLEDCLNASVMGAIEKLVISDRLLHHENDEIREKAIQTIENAEKTRAEVIIVPRDTEAGERLRAFGDVVGLLRFEAF